MEERGREMREDKGKESVSGGEGYDGGDGGVRSEVEEGERMKEGEYVYVCM